VEVKDIQDLCGVVHVGGFHRELVEASERLYEREISVGSRESSNYGKTRWISKYLVDDMNRTIELQFTKDVLPYLTSLKKRFTKYKLEDVSKFSSVYSIRIYEQLAQWKTVGHCEITVEKLREILCLKGKYPKFNDLRRYVIEVATSEINEHSNLDVSYGYRKLGRTIVAIQFRFTSKEVVVETDIKQLPNKKESIDQKGREQHSISQFKILEFVRENEKLTRGKSEYEIRKIMDKNKKYRDT
jgi:plasmid replication initiation protein